jgi:hypothetical protein
MSETDAKTARTQGRAGAPAARRANLMNARPDHAKRSQPTYIASYPKSGIAHRQSDVFGSAAHGDVLLRERSGRNFVLLSEENYQRHARAAIETASLLPMLEAGPEQVPNLPGFAWTAALPIDDRSEFQRETRLLLRQALESSDWTAFERARDQWQESAAIMGDGELYRRLIEVHDASAAEEVVRP